jgi:hypothetical protein
LRSPLGEGSYSKHLPHSLYGNKMTKVKKNKKNINHFNLVTIKPITDNQKQVFSSWKKRTK